MSALTGVIRRKTLVHEIDENLQSVDTHDDHKTT